MELRFPSSRERFQATMMAMTRRTKTGAAHSAGLSAEEVAEAFGGFEKIVALFVFRSDEAALGGDVLEGDPVVLPVPEEGGDEGEEEEGECAEGVPAFEGAADAFVEECADDGAERDGDEDGFEEHSDAGGDGGEIEPTGAARVVGFG